MQNEEPCEELVSAKVFSRTHDENYLMKLMLYLQSDGDLWPPYRCYRH